MSYSVLLQNTYSSAVRLGLSPLEPVEETYKEKIGKFKLVHKITKLVPTQTYSYRDYVALFYEDALKNISPEPKFNEGEIHKYLVERSVSLLEKTGLKEQIDKLDDLRKDNSPSSFEAQQDIVIGIMNKLSSMLTEEEEGMFYIKKYMNSSGFQLSYFADLMNGSQITKKFLNVLERELRLLRGYVRASMQRGVAAALKRHAEGRRALHHLIDVSDSFRVASMSLKTYVEICNSSMVEQLFEPKLLDFNKLNKEEFYRLFSAYRSKLANFEDEVIGRKPELVTSKVDFSQPINNMWKKLATVTI